MKALFKKQQLLYLLTIIIIGGFLRLYGINWDQGHHLHPDERAIVMFTLPLHFPQSINEFLSPTSPLNPHFFAYGNFPLYLLKGTAVILSSFDKAFDSYDRINLLGRAISAIADLGTIILIYFIGRKIFGKTVGITGAFFYSISVFPIQASHFYAVDGLLTFFITLTLFRLLIFYEKPTIKNSIFIGISFALALVTKVSAFPLVVAVLTAICADFFLVFLKKPHKVKEWFPHFPIFLKRLLTKGVIILITTSIFFVILQPYAIIDFQEFLRQTQEQSRMTRDAFTFPYTLQYVGKIPYWYELKNIFFWGQGPILAALSFAGSLYFIFCIVGKHLGWWRRHQTFDSSEVDVHLRGVRSATSKVQIAQELIIVTFFWIYFFVVGKFAVGWMRYMLPLYPLLALFGATFVLKLYAVIKNRLKINPSIFIILNSLFMILVFIWPLSFMHIYTKPNTRVLASQWIYQNIPADKTIAREHWDDGMPIGGNVVYRSLELPIYGMGDPITEKQIYQTVEEADYIIIASNRLYVPLQRISKNCQKWNLPQDRCSHNANRYYEKLFSGKNVILNEVKNPMGSFANAQDDKSDASFTKVAEFSVYPKLEVSSLELEVDDSSADESFTVYDHPKVMIFKKI